MDETEIIKNLKELEIKLAHNLTFPYEQYLAVQAVIKILEGKKGVGWIENE